MNDDKISSNSSENSFQKNQPEFKFKRQNDRALTNINSGREIWYFKNEMLIKRYENIRKNFNR